MTASSRPGRRSHAERSAQTRQHLISTAIDLIGQQGFGQMSIHALARSAGLTSGAVQHHFESKAVLMMQVLDELLRSHIDAGEFWPPVALGAQERAARFLQTLHTLVYAQPRFLVAWNIYLGSRGQPEVLDHIARQRDALDAQLSQGFFATFPELAAQPDREALLGLVFSTLRGLGLLQLFEGHGRTPPSASASAQLALLAELIAARCAAPAAKPPSRSAGPGRRRASPG
ncbi:TetR/AcrR family transcriptional regulator [Pseudacidovorax intermedius]|uniref:TetR/AcrR family transcriptional regulator n=1 Tax=Pseudacidovorax intermedius TaxID=433924 RepID=UPI0026F35AA3|nr:TetR/AcrR family transcriptional regulator [Pseudacidovorax intermedius]